MSVEFSPKPIKDLEEVIKGLQAESKYLANKSVGYSGFRSDLVSVEGVEHSDGATNQRMAEVYLHTSEQIGVVLLQYKRAMVRAMNPYFSRLSDTDVDEIIKKYDEQGIFG